MKVDNMPAGPDMNALVAREVLDWKVTYKAGKNVGDIVTWLWNPDDKEGHAVKVLAADNVYVWFNLHAWSTDMNAAMEGWAKTTEDKVSKRNGSMLVWDNRGPNPDSYWDCELDDPWVEASAKAAPLAICRAALKSVGIYEVEDES